MFLSDGILRGFLERQEDDGRALVKESDIVKLDFLSTGQHVVAHFSCGGLVKDDDGEVREANSFHIGIYFSENYLRAANPYETLTLFDPLNVYHPNVAFGAPFICVGRIAPGTPLVDLVYRCYEVLSYQRLTPREDDALNKEACRWARANQSRFPVDRRPLKRRRLAIGLEQV